MEDNSAEICCIAQQDCANPRERNAILGYHERLCVNNGVNTIFILST